MGQSSKGAGDVFKGGCAGGTSFWVGNVGDDPPHGTVHGGFQHRVVRRITGRQPNRQVDGSWQYPPLNKNMQEAGLNEMG